MIILIATTLGGDSDGGEGNGSSRPGQVKQEKRDGPVPKIYVVQSGDTLTSIARETGVPVATIVQLNPGVDPQILISGEELKLR